VKPLIGFFAQHDMEMIDIQFADIHGGSFRVYISRKGDYPVGGIVKNLLDKENEMGLYSHATLDKFSEDVKRNRSELTWLLHSLKREGKSIVGVSAPAKGMTLLNYCRIGNDLLDVVSEKSTLKIGRYTPGMHIPVVADDYLLQKQPDFALLLAWNFAEEIMKNLDAYRKRGGKFIIPIPMPKVV
jgi:hypothetical protein